MLQWEVVKWCLFLTTRILSALLQHNLQASWRFDHSDVRLHFCSYYFLFMNISLTYNDSIRYNISHFFISFFQHSWWLKLNSTNATMHKKYCLIGVICFLRSIFEDSTKKQAFFLLSSLCHWLKKTIFQKAWNSLSHFYQRGKCFEERLQGGKDVNKNILSE